MTDANVENLAGEVPLPAPFDSANTIDKFRDTTMISNDVKSWVVLVVDDERDNLGVAEKILSFYGAKVHIAYNGLEGLSALLLVSPTFVLLDLSMPQMDGWEMLAKMRASPDTRDIPVIALTAHAMEGDQERVLAAGFNGYIAKPYRLSTFLTDIRKCLGLVSESGS